MIRWPWVEAQRREDEAHLAKLLAEYHWARTMMADNPESEGWPREAQRLLGLIAATKKRLGIDQ